MPPSSLGTTENVPSPRSDFAASIHSEDGVDEDVSDSNAPLSPEFENDGVLKFIEDQAVCDESDSEDSV